MPSKDKKADEKKAEVKKVKAVKAKPDYPHISDPEERALLEEARK